ncbi:PhoU domain-containing protein [Deltaproteobacteria bacterium TL4]
MAHYEERLEKDLARIRQKITAVSVRVEEALRNAVNALLIKNHKLASDTIIGDNIINREIEDITQACYAFVARHLPSAGHLRRITAILRFCVELERVGDYAVTISRQTVQLSKPLDKDLSSNVELISEEARQILHQATTAFVEENAETAKTISDFAKKSSGRNFEKVFKELTRDDIKNSWELKDLFGLLSIFAVLSRVSDQSRNICEETVFVSTGETKKRKPIRFLFLDQTNSCQSLIAESIAQKAFPNSTRASSAGIKPAASLDPKFIAFMDRSGFNVELTIPKALSLISKFDDFDVIVSLQGPILSYLTELPFHSIALEWNMDQNLSEVPENQKDQVLETMYKDISHQLHSLMEIIRGKEAS